MRASARRAEAVFSALLVRIVRRAARRLRTRRSTAGEVMPAIADCGSVGEYVHLLAAHSATCPANRQILKTDKIDWPAVRSQTIAAPSRSQTAPHDTRHQMDRPRFLGFVSMIQWMGTTPSAAPEILPAFRPAHMNALLHLGKFTSRKCHEPACITGSVVSKRRSLTKMATYSPFKENIAAAWSPRSMSANSVNWTLMFISPARNHRLNGTSALA